MSSSQEDARRQIARRLKAALERAGVGQNELGRELGKVGSAVSGWLSGRTQPSLEALAYICRRTATSADEILGLAPVPAGERHDLTARVAAALEKIADETATQGKRVGQALAEIRKRKR